MSNISIDRPGFNQTCLNVLDGVWMSPARIAHAQELRRAADQVLTMSDADFAARGVTRQQALLRISRSV